MVPGLLQTPEYARAVTRAAVGAACEEQLDALVEVRIARQDVLRAEPPLELSAVLDEAVLRREVGGPEVMARQLRRLAEAAATASSAAAGTAVHRGCAHRRHRAFRYLLISEHF